MSLRVFRRSSPSSNRGCRPRLPQPRDKSWKISRIDELNPFETSFEFDLILNTFLQALIAAESNILITVNFQSLLNGLFKLFNHGDKLQLQVSLHTARLYP